MFKDTLHDLHICRGQSEGEDTGAKEEDEEQERKRKRRSQKEGQRRKDKEKVKDQKRIGKGRRGEEDCEEVEE